MHRLIKSIGCTIWILGALLVIATLDALPDPPAVDPHTVNAKASCLREYSGDEGVQYLICELPSIAPVVPTLWVGLADAGEAHRAVDGLALMRHAADSSPPAPLNPQPRFRS